MNYDYNRGFTIGFWFGAAAGCFSTLLLCLLIGAYVPLP